MERQSVRTLGTQCTAKIYATKHLTKELDHLGCRQPRFRGENRK